MPKKTSVSLTLRIAREDDSQELVAVGTLHRLVTGWAVTCTLPAASADSAADTTADTVHTTDSTMRNIVKGSHCAGSAEATGDSGHTADGSTEAAAEATGDSGHTVDGSTEAAAEAAAEATGDSGHTADSGSTDMTLTIRKDEIRLKRSGALKQEQLFRVGQWQRGMIDTGFGRLETEAWTSRLHVGLAASGGTVEWEYDLRVADQPLGRSTITLHIREE